MRFGGLFAGSIADDDRSLFQKQQELRLRSKPVLAEARSAVAARSLKPGFLADDPDASNRRDAVLSSLTWDPNAETMMLTVASIGGSADDDRERLLALLGAARDAAEDEAAAAATQPAISRVSKQTLAQLESLRRQVSELQFRLEEAAKLSDTVGPAESALVQARQEADRAAKALDDNRKSSGALEAEVARLDADIKRLASTAVADEQDAQLQQLLANLKTSNDALAAATSARDAQVGKAREAMDAAQKAFDATVAAARKAAGGDAALSAYLEKLQALQPSCVDTTTSWPSSK